MRFVRVGGQLKELAKVACGLNSLRNAVGYE